METFEKNIEEITLSNTAEDAWENIDQEFNEKTILYVALGETVNFRLLGPLLPCYKLYINLSSADYSQIGIEKFRDICKAKISTINRNDPAGVKELIYKINDKKKWQKCILSNVYLFPEENYFIAKSGINVYSFDKNVFNQLLQLIGLKNKNYNANGLFACNITVKNVGKQNDMPLTQPVQVQLSNDPPIPVAWSNVNISQPSTWNNLFSENMMAKSTDKRKNKLDFSISEPSHLNKKQIQQILNSGLCDLKKICSENNKKFMRNTILHGFPKGYIYLPITNCKMTEDLYKESMKKTYNEMEINEQNEQHMNQTDEQLNDLPTEMFEKIKNNETISSLQL